VISRRLFVATIVGVCILSAGIGTCVTSLLAEQGPAGPQGVPGPRGFAGPPGRSADVSYEVSDLQAAVDDLDFRVSGLEDSVAYGDIDALDSRISDLESLVDDLCYELDLYCY
jgi:hypothetical protein